MKRIISLILVLTFALLSFSMLFSCEESQGSTNNTEPDTNSSTPDTHQHTFEQDWTITKDGHYRACTCHSEVVNLKEHVDLLDRNGICDVCEYVLVHPDTYTLTIIDQFGAPVKNAEIMFRASTADKVATTDENGQAKIDLTDSNGLNVWLMSVPDGYEMPQKDIFSFVGFELTITITMTPDTIG